MDEVTCAIEEKRMLECFGTGTAAQITPVKQISYKGNPYDIPLDPMDSNAQNGPLARKFFNTLQNIQYGETDHHFSVIVP